MSGINVSCFLYDWIQRKCGNRHGDPLVVCGGIGLWAAVALIETEATS